MVLPLSPTAFAGSGCPPVSTTWMAAHNLEGNISHIGSVPF